MRKTATCFRRLAGLESQGDLVTRLLMGITRVPIWIIGVISILTKSPDPLSKHGCSISLNLLVTQPGWANKYTDHFNGGLLWNIDRDPLPHSPSSTRKSSRILC